MTSEQAPDTLKEIEEVRADLLLTFFGFLTEDELSVKGKNTILYKGREFFMFVEGKCSENPVLRFVEKNAKTTGFTFSPVLEKAERFKEKVFLYTGFFENNKEA